MVKSCLLTILYPLFINMDTNYTFNRQLVQRGQISLTSFPTTK